MKNLKQIIFLFFSLLLLFGCRKNELETEERKITTPPVMMVEASLIGKVKNENGDPVDNVQVTVENSVIYTDENGVFKFDNIQMNQFGTFIKTEKEGYFITGKFIQPRLGSQSYMEVTLLQKEILTSFSAVDGGEVTTNGGAKILFPANAIQTEDGLEYTGMVTVFAKWLNPIENSTIQNMPGDLRGIDKDGGIVQMATFGMMGVELETPDGTALNIAAGQEATIEIPIPSAILGSAPATIPLWHFNETTGYWEEEGTALLQGSKYIGTVSHFSFWNCDFPFDLVEFSGRVADNDGNYIPYIVLRMTLEEAGFVMTTHAYTDNNGYFSGKVPKDKLLKFEIIDWCLNDLYVENIGPLSEDTVYTDVVLDGSSANYTFDFKGTLVDCDGNPIANGYAELMFSNSLLQYVIPTDAQGRIDGILWSCNAAPELLIRGIDYDELKGSDFETFAITGLSSLDIGDLVVCEDLEEYIQFTIDGGTVNTVADIFVSLDAPQQPGITFSAWAIDSTSVWFHNDDGSSIGTYMPRAMSVIENIGNSSFLMADCNNDMECANMTLNITQSGTVGEVMKGNFSGQLLDKDTGLPRQVEGNFRAIIDQ